MKITTGDAARVSVEFLAANENVRSQIENHSEELANILRGRGVNLQSLTTRLEADDQNDSTATENSENEGFSPPESFLDQLTTNALTDENTFVDEAEKKAEKLLRSNLLKISLKN